MFHDVDLRGLLPSIRVPTLILAAAERSRRDREHAVPRRSLPDGALVEIEGDDPCPGSGDSEAVLDEIQEFLTGEREPPTRSRARDGAVHRHRGLDREGRGARATQRWRELLEHHDERRARDSWCDGVEVDTAGDGFLATFDGPARAVQCARGDRGGRAPLGIEIRAGLHTGEVELVGDDVGRDRGAHRRPRRALARPSGGPGLADRQGPRRRERDCRSRTPASTS